MSQASILARAREMALRTPESRNRYVDFLRAASIGAVVLGHWIIAAPWISSGVLRLDHMLALEPWTQWLTLLFQVMPVFFLVGGYSNAASWDAAQRSGEPYGAWIAGRMRRLVGPVLPLLVVWAGLAVLFRAMGVRPERIRAGSQLALVPLWFLAVYLLVALLVPWTRRLWARFGIASYWAFAAAAALTDIARFALGLTGIAWVNYLFVWLGVHQLGYLWRDGRIAGPRRSLPWAVGGAVAWAALVVLGPYPKSMVGVPGEDVSNTLPPTILLTALGAAQAGLILAAEGPMRRWLARAGPWTAVVLVNGTIMSVYLWHLTSLSLLVGLASLLGGAGLHLVPGTRAWWAARIPWIAALAAGLGILLSLFGRFERLRARQRAAPLPVPRALAGATLVAAGLALAALFGIGGARAPGINLEIPVLVFAGAALLDVFPLVGRREEGRA